MVINTSRYNMGGHTQFSAGKAMKVSRPSLVVQNGKARLVSRIRCGNDLRELWYEVPETYADWFAADRCDGFVVGLLLQAMGRGEDMVVDGPVSSHLWHSLSHFYIPMLKQAFPSLHPIKILPESLTTEPAGGRGVATGFSGGIDSFTAVIQHLVRETCPDHRVTHFLFHNSGGHGHGGPEDDCRLFWKRFERVRPFAAEVGIPMIAVDSNIGRVFPVHYGKVHSALNASVPLVLQQQFRRYYYASGQKYADCRVVPGKAIARLDPLALHLLSTESFTCVSTGCQWSRVEKIRLVSTFEPSYRYLNVCISATPNGANCLDCRKCRRTLLTLDLLGCAHLYGKVFDLERYRSIRARCVCKVLLHHKRPYDAEVIELLTTNSGPLWRAAGAVRAGMKRLAVWRN